MLTIGNKHLRKRYIYPNNVVDVYTGHNHIWPYITDVITLPWMISLSASPMIVPASGGVVTLTYSAERTVTTTWVHYDGTSSNYYTTHEIETAVASVTSTIGSISGNKLTIPENPSTTSRDIKVTATYGGNSKIVIITQEAAGESEPTIIGYGEWQLTVTANPTSVSSTGGNSTITAACKRSVNWSNGNTTTEYSNTNITLNTDYGTLNNTSVNSNNGTSTLTIGTNTTTQSNVATITASCQGKTATCSVTQEASEQNVPDWSDWELEIYRDGDNPQQWYVDSSAQTITFTIKCYRYDKNGIEDDEYYPTDTTNAFDINISCSNGGTTSHDLINYNNLSNTTLTVTIPAFDENSDAYNPTTGVCSYVLGVDSDTTNHGGMPYMNDDVVIQQSAPVQ